MIKTKHTPAPWYVTKKNETTFIIKSKNTMKPLALVANRENRPSEANAHLIAAAPELLEALEFLVDDIDWQPDSQSLKMVKKVIKKAKGGQCPRKRLRTNTPLAQGFLEQTAAFTWLSHTVVIRFI